MHLTAISAMILVTATGAAVAQQERPPLSPPAVAPHEGSDARARAPVGHRQPRQSDLPPDVVRREQGLEPRSSEPPRSSQQTGIDPELRICRPC